MNIITTRTFPRPPICRREILRYAACREETPEIAGLLDSCMEEAQGRLTYRACFRELPVTIAQDEVDFGLFRVRSQGLARNLAGCESCVVLAATVGVEIDRLIARYGRLSPARALMFQAIGTERIEALCDDVCRSMDRPLRPRFSPGYGDLPLETQRELFRALDCTRQIGLFLNDSLLMSPSKSVTAFAGIGGAQTRIPSKCSACTQQDCQYRGVV